MKPNVLILAALVATAGPAVAGSRIDTLCGAGHINESVGPDDVTENPDGYYIRSLRTQLTHGDPRIVQGVGSEFHICTRSAATPEMEAGIARLLMEERAVKYLFVPLDCPRKGATS